MRVGIVGLGLIGGSLGLALRASRWATVVAFDADPGVRQRAVDFGAADDVADSPEDLAESVDLLVLAAPPKANLDLLPLLGPLLRPDAVLTDVGSVKREFATLVQAVLPERCVPSHPMAGSERHGLDAARADLFNRATWPITPLSTNLPEAVARVETMVRVVGASPIFLTPEEHDRAVSVTSHAPHVIAYALSALAKEREASGESISALAAGGFHSTTRVAASSPMLWAQICRANRLNVLDALSGFRATLDQMTAALESGDAEALERAFAKGHKG